MRSNKPFSTGDRVTSRIRRGDRHTFTSGVITSGPGFDPIAGRCCIVSWDDGSETYVCTCDLRRAVVARG